MNEIPPVRSEAPPVLIRPGRVGDLARIAEIYNEAVDEGLSNCDLSEVAQEEMAAWLGEHQGSYPLFVAESGDEVVGWGCLSRFVDKTCFDRTAYSSTYVAGNHRRRGIGRRLRHHAVAEARRLGFHALVNRIFVRNTASTRLTEQLGFVRIGVLREVIWKDGEYWDAALYELILDP
jgi:L-amino acid N-acyltransferase